MMTSMHKLLFLPLAAFLLAVLGCSSREGHALLERAESLLPIRHDSAEVYLDSIPHPDRLAEDSRALYGLLRTIVQNRQGKGVRSDSLIRGSYEYYRDASRAGQTSDEALLRRYAQSCYYMALFYYNRDSVKQCEDLLHYAIKSGEQCEDWHTCYLAYNILCKTTGWGNKEYALQQALEALDCYYKIKDNVKNEILILATVAGKYLLAGYPDSALKYEEKGYELAINNNLLITQNQMCMKLASTYCYIGEYEKALDYAKRGIATAGEDVLVSSLLNLSSCYAACDSLEQSKKILKSIPCDSNYLDKYIILRDLSEIAIKQRDFDSLFIYVDSAYECLEDRYFHLQEVKDEYYQENLAKELEKEKVQHKAALLQWIWASFFMFFLLITSYVIYNVLKNNKRAAAEQQKEMQHQQRLLHHQSLTRALLQKYLLEKMEHVRTLLVEGKTVSEAKAWQEIEMLLDNTDNGFVQKLRQLHPDFKEEDIHLCMLVRLKISNAAISHIYNIGISAVKKRKLRIKKDIFNVSAPTVTLDEIVEKL